MAHFARVADGATNPITLGRSYYWQARAAEALGRDHDARSLFEAAARYPTAYYGQLARARLGLDEVTLRELPDPSADHRMLELARVFEILYAIDNRDLIASMAADLGDKATDLGALVTLADVAARHNDARATLLIGKLALGRGYPMERYAFPEFRRAGLSADRAAGRAVRGLFDRAAGKRLQSARRVERQCDRPDAGDAGRPVATPPSGLASLSTSAA